MFNKSAFFLTVPHDNQVGILILNRLQMVTILLPYNQNSILIKASYLRDIVNKFKR